MTHMRAVKCKLCPGYVPYYDGLDQQMDHIMYPVCMCKRDEGPGTVFIRMMFLLALTAQCGNCKAQPPPDPHSLSVEGVPGVWFAEPDARRMLSVWREADRLRLRIPVLEHMIENRQAALDVSDRRINLADETINDLLVQNERLARLAKPRWFQSPLLWAFIGAAIATAITLGVTLQ